MKKLLLLTCVVVLYSQASVSAAEEKKTVKSSIENVTVFFQGAELIHKATSTLVKGENEIYISNLSPNIDQNSLKIKASNGAVITSYEYSIDFLNKKEVSNMEQKLQDSIKYYQKELRDIDVKMATNDNLIKLLDANKSIGGTQNGLNVAELMKMMDYYQSKSNEIQNAKRNYEDTQKRLKERVSLLQLQINQEKTKNAKSSGVLKVNLSSALSTTAVFTISYYTTASRWVPYYDINVQSTDKPIIIASKAKVLQTTGLDWNKVKLTLSTSTPSNGKVAPLFDTWFLDFQYPVYKSAAGVAVQNSYSYDQMELAAEPAAPSMKIRGAGSVSASTSPLVIIDGVPMEGVDLASIDASMIDNVQVLKDASATSIYGARGSNGVVLVTTKKDMSDFISQEDNQLNITYNIDVPYTIEGNGKAQNIDLNKYEVNAEFKYYCAPKLDTETFLLAEISDWEKLGLLSGKANVTYDGSYIGETTIDASSTHKKLSLTLGTDKRVVVKREKLQDYSSKKFLGSDVKQEFVYKITVKNNQSKPIKMVLKEQYPTSMRKEIEVELLKETTPATFKNEEVGVYSWEFDLNSSETKEFKMSYTVKYPKDKTVNL